MITRSGWKERKGKLPKGRGLGVACSHYVSGAANSIIRSDMPHSTVNIKIDRDGGVVVYTGASEIGQGSDTMTAQVVAEVLGCDISRVKVIAADTDLTPIDLGSYSSRVTFMAGNAALRAAEDVKKNIVSAAAKRMECAPGRCRYAQRPRLEARVPAVGLQSHCADILEEQEAARGHVDGQILRGSVLQTRKEEAPKDHMSFEEAVVAAIDFHGGLTGTGSYAPPVEARGGKHKGGGVGPSPAYSYSAQVADVSVDEETGEVTVHKIWAAHDCGRALNPVAVEGQVIGSVWMGLGQALEEEMVWKDGLLMNPGHAGVPQSVVGRIARDRMHYRREYRSRRAVRREGSGRRFAGGNDSGNLKCDLRRCGSSIARGAVHAGACAGGLAREEGNEANRNDRVGRSDGTRRSFANMAVRCGSVAKGRRDIRLTRRDRDDAGSPVGGGK